MSDARGRSPAEPEVRPLTVERWDDLVRLFGERGAYGGCWCMFFRLPRKEFDAGARNGGLGNRAGLRALVEAGEVPGLLAYLEEEPVGWVSVAPRDAFGRVERSAFGRASPTARGGWAIVCFFVDRRHRGRGVGRALLRAAIEHARREGARALEAYPVDASVRRPAAAEAFVGLSSMFEAEGFREVARPYPSRPLVRRALGHRADPGRGAGGSAGVHGFEP